MELPILIRQIFNRLVFLFYKRKHHILAYMLIVAMLVVVGVGLDRLNTDKFLIDLKRNLKQEEYSARTFLEGEIVSKALLMRGFAATIASNPDITQEHYAVLAEHLIMDDPSIINIAGAPDLVVQYVYPLEPNRNVLGFDYRTSEIQLEQVNNARLSSGVTLDGPVELVQGGHGFIFRSSVFTINQTTGKQKFWGIASIVIKASFLNGILTDNDQHIPVEIALKNSGKGANSEVFFGNERVFDRNPLLSTVVLPNGLWTMGIIPKGGWPTRADDYIRFRLSLFSFGGSLFLLTCYIGWLFEKKRNAENILKKAVEVIDGGFVLYSADSKFVTCNQNYKDIYKLSANLFVSGCSFEHIIREGMARGEYPSITEQKEEWIKWRLERHKLADVTDEHCLPNGRWIRVSETKLVDGSTVGMHIDITELVLAKQSAEQANSAKSAFLNTLSHELRTPLTIILGYARILLNMETLPLVKELQVSIKSSPTDTDEIQSKLASVMTQITHQAGKISESGEHLLALITDILDFSKADAGELKFEKQIIPVGSLVDSVVGQFTGLAEEKGLHLSYKSNGGTIFADQVRTKQILINLVGNAIKYTDAGSVTIKTEQKGNEVTFSVEDTGCGIPESDISAVFTEFHQVDNSDTRKKGGTGLGLPIVRWLVELQGGNVALSSVLGKGATFSFTLPTDEPVVKVRGS